MKFIILFSFFLLTIKISIANEIDNLKTHNDVEQFLIDKFDKDFQDVFFIYDAPQVSSAYRKGKFFKIDLDNNGLSDLIVNGRYLLIVIDNGKGKFQSHIINKGGFDTGITLDSIIHINTTPLLLVKEYRKMSNNNFSFSDIDSLIYKFDYFIEYNPIINNINFDELIFKAGGCYGSCPIFDITLKADRRATFIAIAYNDKTGTFKSKIDKATFLQILETINYLNIQSLKEGYRVGWSDDRTVTLEIKYNNGQVKKITDYGASGTWGLQNLYNQLYSLRDSQKWRRF